MLHSSAGEAGGQEKKRRRKPGASFLHMHLTESLWRLQLWKMKISFVVLAFLIRVLFAGRKKFTLLHVKVDVVETKCFPLFFRET